MKKILYTALAASLFAFSSCDDILDTSKKSSMEKTEVFSNEALVNDVVMGLHQSFGETNSYRGRYIAYFGVNSDCEIWNNTGKKGAFTDKEGALVTYNATTDNQYMNTDNNVWAKLYEAQLRWLHHLHAPPLNSSPCAWAQLAQVNQQIRQERWKLKQCKEISETAAIMQWDIDRVEQQPQRIAVTRQR